MRIATVRSEPLSEHNDKDPPPEKENCDGLTIVMVRSDLIAKLDESISLHLALVAVFCVSSHAFF